MLFLCAGRVLELRKVYVFFKSFKFVVAHMCIQLYHKSFMGVLFPTALVKYIIYFMSQKLLIFFAVVTSTANRDRGRNLDCDHTSGYSPRLLEWYHIVDKLHVAYGSVLRMTEYDNSQQQ